MKWGIYKIRKPVVADDHFGDGLRNRLIHLTIFIISDFMHPKILWKPSPLARRNPALAAPRLLTLAQIRLDERDLAGLVVMQEFWPDSPKRKIPPKPLVGAILRHYPL